MIFVFYMYLNMEVGVGIELKRPLNYIYMLMQEES